MRRQLGSFERAAVETSVHAAFNAVAVMRLRETPDLEALRAGLDALQRREPLLRARVVRARRRLWFRPDVGGPIPLSRQRRHDEAGWQTVAERELASGFDLETGPLARAILVAEPDGRGPSELLVTLHHAIVDAAGFVALCRELLAHGFDDTTDSTSPAPSLAARPDDLFPSSFRGLAGRARLAAFLGRQLADELRWRLAVRGKRRPTAPATATGRVFPIALTEAVTSELVRRARSERVALVAALDAALLLTARELLYDGEERPLRYFCFPDLRGSLHPRPRTGSLGGYLTVMRFTASMESTVFWELARELHGQMRRSFQRGDKFASALAAPLAMRKQLRARDRMGSVAASFSGPADGPGGVSHPKLERLHAFVSNLAVGPEVTAQVRLFGGRLLWDFVYLEEDFGRQTMATIATALEARLAEAATA